jgi:hypothetical protein
MRLLIGLGLVVTCFAGCVDEPNLSQTEQTETVVDPPTPFASCSSGCWDGHVVGEPTDIYTSYHGYCHELWDYPCLDQDYTLTAECDLPCEAEAPKQIHGDGSIRVRSLAPGALTVTLHFDHEVSTGWGDETESEHETRTIHVTSYEPDHVELTCVAGRHQQPCSETAVNPPPVLLGWGLYAGTKRLDPETTTHPFFLIPSLDGENAGPTAWQTSEGGHLNATVRRGLLENSLAIDIAYVHPPRGPAVENDVNSTGSTE